jgi:hypothetical protein
VVQGWDRLEVWLMVTGDFLNASSTGGRQKQHFNQQTAMFRSCMWLSKVFR